MKKILTMAVALILALSLLPCAFADDTVLDGLNKRTVTLNPVGLNDAPEGVSPTTGLPLSDYDVESLGGFAGLAVTGRYHPMLVQISNENGGVNNGEHNTAPWGATYADIIYESPLHKSGYTRISMLFSDLIPDSVGPVRSARVGHTWLREEWDAGFLYYGGQTREGSDIEEEFRTYGATKKGVLFSGTVGSGKPWKKYYTRRSGVAAPNNVDANVAAMYELIPTDHTCPNHAFLFTDDYPEGEDAWEVEINWNAIHYGSTFTYDEDANLYYRFMRYENGKLIPYEDRDLGDQLAFSNIIIQFTSVKYNGSSAAPVTTHVGEGNAEYFMGGVHIPGYWKRDSMDSRTVFYDLDGNEIKLQRGKTFISILPEEDKVTFR